MTIAFEDDSQDFLEWDLDESGKVIDCRPFQADVWCGVLVLNAGTLQPGSEVQLQMKNGEHRTLTHLVEEVRC